MKRTIQLVAHGIFDDINIGKNGLAIGLDPICQKNVMQQQWAPPANQWQPDAQPQAPQSAPASKAYPTMFNQQQANAPPPQKPARESVTPNSLLCLRALEAAFCTGTAFMTDYAMRSPSGTSESGA